MNDKFMAFAQLALELAIVLLACWLLVCAMCGCAAVPPGEAVWYEIDGVPHVTVCGPESGDSQTYRIDAANRLTPIDCAEVCE